jgi:hypothetical protein
MLARFLTASVPLGKFRAWTLAHYKLVRPKPLSARFEREKILQGFSPLSRACASSRGVDDRPPSRTAVHKSAWAPPKSPSTNPKLYMVFTCANCETRAVKSFSKSAYEKGVVLVQCPGCQKQHVIADHLGWFGEHSTVEEILRMKGESVRKITDADLGDLEVHGAEKPGDPH